MYAIAMRGCSGAAQRGACCVHSCHRIRRCDGAGNCRIKHSRVFCRAQELFGLPRLVFVRNYGARTPLHFVGAAVLLSGDLALCTAAQPDARWLRRWPLLIKHNRGFCRAHEHSALPRLVFVRDYGACTRLQRVRATRVLGKACALCTAASDAIWCDARGAMRY